MSNVIMIIAPEKFRDEELFETKEILEERGHTITIASTKKGTCKGMLGRTADAEIILNDVHWHNFDAVIFVGGSGTELLYNNKEAIRIAQEMHTKGKLVAAICLAPVILANAGLLKGVNATVYETAIKMIQNKGALYTGTGVTVDENIVTANGPQSAKAFGQQIAVLLESILHHV